MQRNGKRTAEIEIKDVGWVATRVGAGDYEGFSYGDLVFG